MVFSVPSSPEVARPPKRARSAIAKQRIAAMFGFSEDPHSWSSCSNGARQRGVAAWQQQGMCLREPNSAMKRPRLSDSLQEVQFILPNSVISRKLSERSDHCTESKRYHYLGPDERQTCSSTLSTYHGTTKRVTQCNRHSGHWVTTRVGVCHFCNRR